MNDKPAVPPAAESIPNLVGGIAAIASAQAPFLYFEGAPFFGFVNGIGRITLEAGQQIAPASDGTRGVQVGRVLVAHLVGNIVALKNLRNVIDAVILMAEPEPGGPVN